MKFEIKNRFNGELIFSADCESLKICVELSISSKVNLSSADLRYADLRYTDLRYADLRSADLRSANLHSADLRYANLRSADLRSANLHSADLRYANLRSARWGKLIFCGLASLVWTGHGECGRQLTGIKFGGSIRFWCGCFSGDQKELSDYIKNGNKKYTSSRMKAMKVIVSLLREVK